MTFFGRLNIIVELDYLVMESQQCVFDCPCSIRHPRNHIFLPHWFLTLIIKPYHPIIFRIVLASFNTLPLPILPILLWLLWVVTTTYTNLLSISLPLSLIFLFVYFFPPFLLMIILFATVISLMSIIEFVCKLDPHIWFGSIFWIVGVHLLYYFFYLVLLFGITGFISIWRL